MTVSFMHQALVELFRERPALAAELLRDLLGFAVPSFSGATAESAELDVLQPIELRADLVILLRDGAPVLVIVLEVQLRVDERKRDTWPAYITIARLKFGCPAVLLVIAPDAKVAAWARTPIALGPKSLIHIDVLGPDSIPPVTNVNEARAHPELAILSAIAHVGSDENGPVVAAVAIEAIRHVPGDNANVYLDLVLAAAPGSVRAALEELMSLEKYEYQSDFAKKYYGEGKAEGKAEGRAEGKADALLAILTARAIVISEAELAVLRSTRDLVKLDAWLARAVSCSSAAELIAG